MNELVLSSEDIGIIRRELLGASVESCAILYTNQTSRDDGDLRLLVRGTHLPLPSDYSRRGRLEAELKPEFVAAITKRARLEKCGLVFVHSHPGNDAPEFSIVDDQGEERLARFLAWRHPEFAHAAMVVSDGGLRARELGRSGSIRVVELGKERKILADVDSKDFLSAEMFDRQVRAFGADGQRTLNELRVAIVGLGGMGSIISQQLVHLGVRTFMLVDPDTIEGTNLNRVANALNTDVGSAKVDIAARYIHAASTQSAVDCMTADITHASIARRLRNADLIFGCTDSHGSRAVLQQVAYQYFIPCIDMGATIAVSAGRVTHIYGRVQLLSPGFACLTCCDLLNPSDVRRDMMTAFERQADPYLQGVREPAPAVMSLNGTVASLAVSMMLSVFCGVPMEGRYILYNAIDSVLRKVHAQPKSNCYICSRSGSFARGDAWPLMARQD